MAHMKKFEHLKIQLDVIKSATNNFADESCIGEGGFGKVYKGKIAGSDGHTMVAALKRLDPAFGQGHVEFWKEVMILSLYKHENIVSLLGFCDDFGERILVYLYAPNRSLDCHLNNDNLRWVRRLKICIGAARGLVYLHSALGTEQCVWHRDIKSSNILLDQDWNAKISDFGLSKFVPVNQEYSFIITNPLGTHGYCDPLYLETALLTKETDVYSFGVVLFEVLCGRQCNDNRNANPSLITLARKSYEQKTVNEIVYGNIKDEIKANSLLVFATIAYQCLEREREARPLMSDILEALETALRCQSTEFLASTSSFHRELRYDAVASSSLLPIEDAKGEGAGLLKVTIHKGVNLKVKHPFVVLQVGTDLENKIGSELKQTTPKYNNQNPVWEETFEFALEKPAEETLRLIVGSVSKMDRLLRKNILGKVDISIADVVKEKHIYNISHFENGHIHVELHFEHAASGALINQ